MNLPPHAHKRRSRLMRDPSADRKGHEWQEQQPRIGAGEVLRRACRKCGVVLVRAPGSGMTPLYLGRVFYLPGPEHHFWRNAPLCSEIRAKYPDVRKP